jgi:hypothetical protein
VSFFAHLPLWQGNERHGNKAEKYLWIYSSAEHSPAFIILRIHRVKNHLYPWIVHLGVYWNELYDDDTPGPAGPGVSESVGTENHSIGLKPDACQSSFRVLPLFQTRTVA